MKLFNRNNNIPTRRSLKQWLRFFIILLLRKEFCDVCGHELTEIRGKYPKEPMRKVCACCATEKLERIEGQNNTKSYQEK